jgi:glutamine phosphoribosylpyrophosphate amidotransferase
MCGVIGIELNGIEDEDISLIHKIFLQTMIRGKHATGISYRKGSKIITLKENLSADNFLKKIQFKEFVDNDTLCLLGHIRYSTSDLRYPQPFSSDKYSIVHNGVISQEDSSTWKYKTETANDSELILRSLEHGNDPLLDFIPSSMAVVMLDIEKGITGFRNESRPLWLTTLPKGIVFTSTKNIAIRSGLSNPKRCEMYVKYSQKETIKIKRPKNVKDMQP